MILNLRDSNILLISMRFTSIILPCFLPICLSYVLRCNNITTTMLMLMPMPMPMNNLLCRVSELHLFSFTASARQSYRSFQTSRVFRVRVASVVRHPPCNLSDVGIPKYHTEYELTTTRTGCRHDATWQDDKVNRISPTKYRYDDLQPSRQ